MKKETKQSLQSFLEKYTQKWLEDNQKMVDDYSKICVDIIDFNANWGTQIGIVFNKHEKKGRGLGLENIEDLTDIASH